MQIKLQMMINEFEIIEKKIDHEYFSTKTKGKRDNSQIFSEIVLVSCIIPSKTCTLRNTFLLQSEVAERRKIK